ncbi:MAG TPA: class III extradiol ring-cleavage dioxygenase [Candidatus Baltobacteraceae bacterium]|jgi:aromatic ring-opening dioxygenase catalytic subunit (LigB family)|nr:class III extradiol ring-cleavage dioxygenase [Candidatus Baltobacteraceae bacterium]
MNDSHSADPVNAAEHRLPTLYLPHGGGPCFFMDPMPGLPPDLWDGMATFLRGVDAALGRRPKAVLVISAHWEAARPTVGSTARPTLIYDYSGFPEHTYRLKYPAAGSPALAARVRVLLAEGGLASDEDAQRGLDHGVFVPFLLVYPEADVPVVQLSLLHDVNAGAHVAIGKALAPLRDEGILIVGSGMSFHNLRTFLRRDTNAEAAAENFDQWLNEAVTKSNPAIRNRKLSAWHEAPGATACHPHPEHLLPLMVAAGAAGDDRGHRVYHERLLGKAISGFRFG